MKHTIVIDTSALLHRSKHSLGMQLSNKDMETGIMFGFCIQIGKLASKFKTNRMVFCLDGDRGGTSKRKKLYPDYKVKRIQEKTEAEIIYDKFCFKQFASIIEKFRGFGFKNIVQEPGYEGDDLVASFIIHNPELAKNAVIASSDNDFYQLLHLCRGMILMSKGIIYDKHSFMEEYGITPEQWKDVKMIAGCKSDSVPGVPGVGYPTAAKYLRGELTKGKVFDKITSGEYKDVMRMARRLTTLPFKNTPPIIHKKDKNSLNFDAFMDMCSEYNFMSFINNKENFNMWRRFFEGNYKKTKA